MSAPRIRGRPAACERCGGTFCCGVAEDRCWCQAPELPASARQALATTYRACLCPACLAELATGAEPAALAGPAGPAAVADSAGEDK